MITQQRVNELYASLEQSGDDMWEVAAKVVNCLLPRNASSGDAQYFHDVSVVWRWCQQYVANTYVA
jgi:hypothetical protein